VPSAWHLRGRKNSDLGSELMVGHKVGLSTAVPIPSDGPRRRDTAEHATRFACCEPPRLVR
jgi:hypothetical protein